MTTLEHIAAAEGVRRKRQQRDADYWRNYWAQKLAEAKGGTDDHQAPAETQSQAHRRPAHQPTE